MFWFKNFRIRRVLCDVACSSPSSMVVVGTAGNYTFKRHYCKAHEHIGLFWSGKITGGKVYKDTGAR